MSIPGERNYRDGVYRPQRPKANRRIRVQREMVKDKTSGLVDMVRKTVEENRGQGIGPGRLCRTQNMQQVGQSNRLEDIQKEMLKTGNDIAEDKSVLPKNRRRSMDKKERVVKRNLFGEGDKRSSVNRKLRDKLKAKKKSLMKSRHSNHLKQQSSDLHPKYSAAVKDKSSSQLLVCPQRFSQFLSPVLICSPALIPHPNNYPRFSQILEPESSFRPVPTHPHKFFTKLTPTSCFSMMWPDPSLSPSMAPESSFPKILAPVSNFSSIFNTESIISPDLSPILSQIPVHPTNISTLSSPQRFSVFSAHSCSPIYTSDSSIIKTQSPSFSSTRFSAFTESQIFSRKLQPPPTSGSAVSTPSRLSSVSAYSLQSLFSDISESGIADLDPWTNLDCLEAKPEEQFSFSAAYPIVTSTSYDTGLPDCGRRW